MIEPIELTCDELIFAASQAGFKWRLFDYPSDEAELSRATARGLQVSVARGLSEFSDSGEVTVLSPYSDYLELANRSSTGFLLRAVSESGEVGATLMMALLPDDGSDPVLIVRTDYGNFFFASLNREDTRGAVAGLVVSWLDGSLRNGATGHVEKLTAAGDHVDVATVLVREGEASVEGAPMEPIDDNWARVLDLAGWPATA